MLTLLRKRVNLDVMVREQAHLLNQVGREHTECSVLLWA